MRNIKLGLGLMTALAFSLTMTTSAVASSFLSSAKAKLETLNVKPQVFTTVNGTVECTKASVIAGESTGAETREQFVSLKYENCTFAGILAVSVSPGEYVFLSNGEVHILKLISLNITSTGCETSIPAQLVAKFDYRTSGPNVLLESLVTGILSTASGAGCEHVGHFANATYKSHFELMIPNGTLSFMP